MNAPLTWSGVTLWPLLSIFQPGHQGMLLTMNVYRGAKPVI